MNDNLEKFDTVINTVPLPFVTKLVPSLPKEELQKIDKLVNVAVVCVVIKLKKSISKNFWVNVNDSKMDIPGFVEYTNPDH